MSHIQKSLESEITKRKPHPTKNETTWSITYRLPAKIVDELETEAMQKNISQNVLVRQIMERYLDPKIKERAAAMNPTN